MILGHWFLILDKPHILLLYIKLKIFEAMFTHFQVFIEESQRSEDLQVVVLLPTAVKTLRLVSCLPAAPPVHQPPDSDRVIEIFSDPLTST